MAVEQAKFIQKDAADPSSDPLIGTAPVGSDYISEGDDHLRLLKKVLLQTFPTADRALTAEFEFLNEVPTKLDFGIETSSQGISTDTLEFKTPMRLKNLAPGIEPTDGATVSQIAALQTAVFTAVYPIGSIYMSTVNKNPNDASLLNFGAWRPVVGNLFGAGTVSNRVFPGGQKGGRHTITLSADNIPNLSVDMATSGVTVQPAGKHSHQQKLHEDRMSIDDVHGYWYRTSEGDNNVIKNTSEVPDHVHGLAGTLHIGSTSPQSIDLMNPYTVVYAWERIG